MSIQNVPAEQQPFLYISGLSLSNDATTPHSKLDVSAGQCRDSNDIIDMVYSTATIINCGVNGYNGLDTGSLAVSSFYKVFAIADSANYNPSGFIVTLQTNSVPVMPLGYDSLRLIGYILTDGSGFILSFYMAASTAGNLRYIQYDAPISITVTDSGTSSSYSAMSLAPAVPTANWEKVKIYAKWDPNAAGDVLTFQAAGGTGNWLINTAISTPVQDFVFDILPQLSSSVPKVSYKVSAGALTVVTVLGYDFLV